jgi:hypothetical protein
MLLQISISNNARQNAPEEIEAAGKKRRRCNTRSEATNGCSPTAVLGNRKEEEAAQRPERGDERVFAYHGVGQQERRGGGATPGVRRPAGAHLPWRRRRAGGGSHKA